MIHHDVEEESSDEDVSAAKKVASSVRATRRYVSQIYDASLCRNKTNVFIHLLPLPLPLETSAPAQLFAFGSRFSIKFSKLYCTVLCLCLQLVM